MKSRHIMIPSFLLIAAIILTPVVLAASDDATSPYEIKLTELKKRGECDSTKYTITNHESTDILTTHTFINSNSQEVYSFGDNLVNPGETKTYDLNEMDALLPGFRGDVRVTSSGVISGVVLPFPPCEIIIECTPEFPSPGDINTKYICTATVTPEDALLPITITWYEWDPIEGENRVWYGEKVELSWTTPGYHQLDVTAENPVGSITVRILILIFELYETYLPLTSR